MKRNTHPTYYPNAKVTCSCGNAFTVGSTREKIEVEICNACHPFYTGEEKLVDTAGRVEKFTARRSRATAKLTKKKERRAAKKATKQQATTTKVTKPKATAKKKPTTKKAAKKR